VLLLPQFLHPPRYQVVSFGYRGRLFLTSGTWPSAAREQIVGRLFDAMIAQWDRLADPAPRD
jgi:hypothetical protein